MKKSLLALAVLGAFVGAAQAQSSVTIYGSYDAGLRYKKNVNAAGDSVWTMSSTGTYNSNRLGFKGVEDLGGGLSARFNIETGFNSGTGSLDNANSVLFNRTSTVGLGGAWGGVDLGRQYTVAFRTIAAYDPFAYKYPGIMYAVPATAGVRYNNDIQYSGAFGPVTVRAEYALGEVAGDNTRNSAKAIGASYAAGPVAVGGAYTKRDVNGFDNDHYTLGGRMTFGPVRAYLGYARDNQETATVDTKKQFAWAGVGYTISPAIDLIGAWYQDKLTSGVNGAGNAKKDLFVISATYALSKRTNFYTEIDRTKLKDAYKVGTHTSQTGFSVGINHLF